MRGITCWSVLLSTLCLVLATAPAVGQTGTLVGRVTESGTDLPVVGALVEARGVAGSGSHTVTTNQEGSFRIFRLAPGLYLLRVAAIGYGTQTGDSVQVVPSGRAVALIHLEPVPIELDPLAVTASRRAEKALESPADVAVIGEREIGARPALTLGDHLRSAMGVDIWTGGLQSTRVVTRGFNGIFSSSLHMLTDNRIAGVPSMRVNVPSLIPHTSDDIQRLEVVLGPAAALYGPNTANGVLHVIMKSPIDDPGSVVSVTGGERNVLYFTGRTAARLSSRLGIKISGQYFQGHDWHYTDPVETAERQKAEADFEAWKLEQPIGLAEPELHRRVDRIAARDFDVVRYSLDARADWRTGQDLSVILTAGRTNAIKGIELSGVGAVLMDGWTYGYYQARLSHGRWFAQTYLNANDAGRTFMLRNGAPIVDRSKLWVAQLQHTSSWRLFDLAYGGDLFVTRPETGGTIHGSYEDNDNYAEYGLYLHTKVRVSPTLDLLLAGRWDQHTALNEGVLSPRAALLVKPATGHTFRLTFNRAFRTPTSIHQFIDMDGGAAGSLGVLGFRIHAYGSGKDGYALVDQNGWPLGMHVPGRSGLVEVTAGTVYDAQLEMLAGLLRKDPSTANLVPLLERLAPAWRTGAAQLPVVALDPVTQAMSPVAGSVQDVPGIRPSTSSVWEVGYQGLFGRTLLLAADLWRSKESDFISSLQLQTPLFLLDPAQLGSFLNQNAAPELVSALVQAGQSEAEAREQAEMLIESWVGIPGGVAGSPEVGVEGANLLATNVNAGEVDLWGLDLKARWLISNAWSAGGTYSHVSDDVFCLVASGPSGCGKPLLLNAPRDKAMASLGYGRPANGFSGELRVRHTGGFPVSTSGYIGLECIGGGGEPCVERYTLLDFTVGAGLPGVPDATLQLAITNLLDEEYRSFAGVPKVGRLALIRIRYEF